jgi:hypothetical protein
MIESPCYNKAVPRAIGAPAALTMSFPGVPTRR